MFEPELADRLVERVPARLNGWKRCFNKWSISRGIPPADSGWPEVQVPPWFQTPDLNRSLVLGLEPGDGLEGLVLTYDATIEQVLGAMDAREGFFPDRPRESGYLRDLVYVEYPDGVTGRAWTYLTNFEGGFYMGDLGVETTVRILKRATPPERHPVKAKGLRYLQRVRVALESEGLVDPELETLAEAAARL